MPRTPGVNPKYGAERTCTYSIMQYMLATRNTLRSAHPSLILWYNTLHIYISDLIWTRVMVWGAWDPRGHPKVRCRTYVYLQYNAVHVSYKKHIKKCTPIIDTLIQYTSYIYLRPHRILALSKMFLGPLGWLYFSPRTYPLSSNLHH